MSDPARTDCVSPPAIEAVNPDDKMVIVDDWEAVTAEAVSVRATVTVSTYTPGLKEYLGR